MEKKDFEGKIGKTFKFKLGKNQTVEMKLTAVDPLKKVEGVPDVRQEPFSLVFVGSEEEHLPDNTYTMAVEGWKDQSIFISAYKQDEKGIHYDSVFN